MRGGVKTAPFERRWQLDFRMVDSADTCGLRSDWCVFNCIANGKR